MRNDHKAKRGWTMPVVLCDDCGEPMTPTAWLDEDGWYLTEVCDDCQLIAHNEIDWPFEKDEATVEEMVALGFEIESG